MAAALPMMLAAGSMAMMASKKAPSPPPVQPTVPIADREDPEVKNAANLLSRKKSAEMGRDATILDREGAGARPASATASAAPAFANQKLGVA